MNIFYEDFSRITQQLSLQQAMWHQRLNQSGHLSKRRPADVAKAGCGLCTSQIGTLCPPLPICLLDQQQYMFGLMNVLLGRSCRVVIGITLNI